MSDLVTIAEAAKLLDRSPSTLRRWIANGAPTASLGKEGRGNGSLVRVADLQAWNSGAVAPDDAQMAQRLAVALDDVFKRDAAQGLRAHQMIGIKEWQAAALLVEIFERCILNWTGSIPDKSPREIQTLTALVEQTAHK